MGRQRRWRKHWLFSLTGTSKKATVFLFLARRPMHLCDSTVAASPLLFPARILRGCGGKWGSQDRSAAYYAEGVFRGALSLTHVPRRILSDNRDDDPSGGGGCLVLLPPSLVMHALRTQPAHKAAPPARTKHQTKTGRTNPPLPPTQNETPADDNREPHLVYHHAQKNNFFFKKNIFKKTNHGDGGT